MVNVSFISYVNDFLLSFLIDEQNEKFTKESFQLKEQEAPRGLNRSPGIQVNDRQQLELKKQKPRNNY